MKKIILVIIVVGALSCQSKNQTSRPPVCNEVPSHRGRVNDYADTLTSVQIDLLSAKLKNLETDLGPQIAILLIDSLDDRSIEAYS